MSSIHSCRSSSRSILKKRHNKPNLFFKKHPVTLLYDYGKFCGTRPKFVFTEIHQHSGTEFACIAELEEFFGEGKAFNKKASKAIAAANLLHKIKYGDLTFVKKKKPARYVSQTYVVSVVPDPRGSEHRSTFSDSGVFSSGESVTGQILPSAEISTPVEYNVESIASKFDRMSSSASQTSNMDEDMIDTEPGEEFKKTIDADEPDSAAKKSLLDEINSFCHSNEDMQGLLAVVGELETDETIKEGIKFSDPRQYLEKCCLERGLKPPVYVATVKDCQFEAHCNLMNKLTYGKGDRMSEAKQLAATKMIHLLNW